MKQSNTYENKRVLWYSQFAQLVEEAKTHYQLDNQKKITKDTLKRIQEETGSQSIEGVTKYVLHKKGGQTTKEKVLKEKVMDYIRSIVLELIKKEGKVMASLDKTGDTVVSMNIVHGLIEMMASLTVDEVVHELLKNDREKEADYAEVE